MQRSKTTTTENDSNSDDDAIPRQPTDRGIQVIFDTEQAADAAMNASPLSVCVPTDNKDETLSCTIRPSFYDHAAAQSDNPYHSTYQIVKNSHQYNDIVAAAAAHSTPMVPVRELADGLLSQKERVADYVLTRVRVENERLGAVSLMRLYREGLERKEEEMKRRE